MSLLQPVVPPGHPLGQSQDDPMAVSLSQRPTPGPLEAPGPHVALE